MTKKVMVSCQKFKIFYYYLNFILKTQKNIHTTHASSMHQAYIKYLNKRLIFIQLATFELLTNPRIRWKVPTVIPFHATLSALAIMIEAIKATA